ncbi:MAG: rhomboid family intramembrane serine protease [Gammaproteobacteria bacterium]
MEKKGRHGIKISRYRQVDKAIFHQCLRASGGVFGLLLAFGLAYPHRTIMLAFPPIPMPAWVFVTLYGLLELCLGVTGSGQGIAHFADLGGMMAGYLLLTYWGRQRRAG